MQTPLHITTSILQAFWNLKPVSCPNYLCKSLSNCLIHLTRKWVLQITVSYSCKIKYGTLTSRASLILVHSCTLTEVNVTPWDAFAGTEERCRHSSSPLTTLGKTQYPMYGRMDGPRGPVWTGTENLAPSRIQSPECPACSKSLSQPHLVHWYWLIIQEKVI